MIQDQGLVQLGAAVRDVSGVTRKEAYFGLTDSFNIRGFDASTGLFNGFRHDDVDPWKPELDLVRNGGARIGACRH